MATPDEPATDGDDPLAAGFAALVEDYGRHLRVQRELSAHTVRAYTGDVTGLLPPPAAPGPAIAGGGHHPLPAQLARPGADPHGQSRSTLQRRSAAVRVFFTWAHATGRVPANPAAGLRSPRKERALRPHLARAEAAAMLDAARPRSAPSSARERPAERPVERPAGRRGCWLATCRKQSRPPAPGSASDHGGRPRRRAARPGAARGALRDRGPRVGAVRAGPGRRRRGAPAGPGGRQGRQGALGARRAVCMSWWLSWYNVMNFN